MTRIGSLFSGYGGLEAGVQAVIGGSVAWHCENDPAPSKILAHHWPDVPNLGDITKVDWAAVEPVEAVTAGYPCQPFSHAGQRQGTDDDRHLWPHVADAVGILRPRVCVFENVRGHLTLGFDHVLRDLELLRYDVSWLLLRAADIGAPHGRARIFILARDRHERRVRSGADRRGGVHRDSGVGRVVPGSAQGHDDGQGDAGAAAHGAVSRGEDRRSENRDRQRSGQLLLATDRAGRVGSDPDTAAPADREGGTSGHRASVPSDGGRLPAPPEWAGYVDGPHAGAGGVVRPADQGSEPSWPRPDTPHPAEAAPSGDLPVGMVVGAGGRSVRPGGVPGTPSDVGTDDRGQGLRGAPHGRFRVFIAAWPAGDPHLAGLAGRGAGRGRAGERATGTAGLGPVADADRLGHERGRSARGRGLDLRTTVSLLPTPRATDGTKGGPNQRGSSGDLMLPSAVLLPTPAASDVGRERDLENRATKGSQMELGDVVRLLPTPAVNDMGAGKTPQAWDEWTAKMKAAHGNGNGHGPSLEIEALRLLPTPNTMDGMSPRSDEALARAKLSGGCANLKDHPLFRGGLTPLNDDESWDT